MSKLTLELAVACAIAALGVAVVVKSVWELLP